MAAADRVDADTAEVRAVLYEMLQVVERSGGGMHPAAWLEERAGEMTVRCDPSVVDDAPLFRVPKQMLVPMDGARWSQRTDLLEMLEESPGLTAEQSQLLQLHVALYNACGKVARTEKNHPRRCVGRVPGLAEGLRVLAGGERFAGTASAAEVFLGSRVFRMPRADGGRRVLMTLVDLLNHSRRGAAYRMDATAMVPRVVAAEDGECFARYGARRSPVDIAVTYGYLDRESVSVYSAAVTVDAGAVGRLRIDAVPRQSQGRLNPPRVRRDDEGLLLSHVEFHAEHPERGRSPLQLPVVSAGLAVGLDDSEARRLAARVWCDVVAANIEVRRRLTAATDGSREPGALLLGEALRREIELLRATAERSGVERGGPVAGAADPPAMVPIPVLPGRV